MIAINLLLVGFLISIFGMELYGVFAILMLFNLNGAFSIFDFGLEGAVHYFIAASNSHAKELSIMFYAIILYFTIGLSIIFFLYLLTSQIIGLIDTDLLTKVELLNLYYYVLGGLSVQFLTMPITATLEGKRLFYITKTINIFISILQILLILIIVPSSPELLLVVKILLLSFVAKYMLLLIFLKRHFKESSVNDFFFDFSLLKEIIKYSGVLFISRIIGFIYNQTDKLLILIFLTPVSMAIYDIVTKPIMPIRIIIQIFNSSITPEVASRYIENDFDHISNLFDDFLRYMYILIIPIFFALLFSIEPILKVWLNQEVSIYFEISYFVLAYFFILPIPALATTILTGMKKVSLTIKISMIAAILNLGLSIYLIQEYELRGILFATVFAELLTILPIINRFNYALNRRHDIFKPLIQTLLVNTPLVLFLVVIFSLVKNNYLLIFLSMLACFLQYLFSAKLLLSKKEKLFILSKVSGG